MSQKNAEAIIKEIVDGPHQKVKVAVTDIDGILRGKYIHKKKFISALENGFGFCNVVFGWDCADECYDNSRYTGWHTGYPDAQVMLDMGTARKVPWDNNVPFILGDFYRENGDSLDVCPRSLLKKIVGKAESLGFKTMVGMEFEWFNFKESPASANEKNFHNLEPLTAGMFGCSILRSSENSGFFNDLIDQLEAFNVPIEGIHTETGPGVYEAAIAVDTALAAGDKAVLFKSAVKEIGNKHGILPTFMARWNNSLPGCSGHIHQSLLKESGDPVFFDAKDPHKISPLFKSYLAGQLKLLPDLLPCFAPTVNSYKRLVEGFWAPTRSTWAADNRTAALRVISSSPKSSRVELRVSGSDVNPYIAIAASLAAGLYGIENNLELEQPPVVGNGYETTQGVRFAADLEKSAHGFKNSEIARNLLGDEFVEHFANSRIWEARSYKQAVTDWELRRYFEII